MKKALIIVDFQNDFVNGSLGFEGADNLNSVITGYIKEYRKNNDDIIFTLDTHDNNYLQSLEGKSLPIIHCIEGTLGHELYGDVKNFKKDSDKSFIKHTYGSLKLAAYLKEKEFDELLFVGLVSNICVLTNAVIARTALPECIITVDAKATASYDKILNNKAFDIMEGLNIKVINRG